MKDEPHFIDHFMEHVLVTRPPHLFFLPFFDSGKVISPLVATSLEIVSTYLQLSSSSLEVPFRVISCCEDGISLRTHA